MRAGLREILNFSQVQQPLGLQYRMNKLTCAGSATREKLANR